MNDEFGVLRFKTIRRFLNYCRFGIADFGNIEKYLFFRKI